MNYEVYCGNAHAEPNSSAVQQLAEACVEQDASYFDGCSRTCVKDKYLLPLTQFDNLEIVVYGQIFPILVLFAVFANAAVALVLSKKHMITPTNVVLKYMAIAELLVGLVPLPWTLFFFSMGNIKETHRLELWWCYLQKYSMDAFPPVFHMIAMWLTVLLAAQRYVSISHPLHSRSACNVKNVRLATMIITVTSFLCGLPKSFDYEYETVHGWIYSHGNWTYASSCVMMPTAILTNMGQTVYFNIYFWTRALGFIILPSFLLVLLNGLLIKGIRRAQRRKLRLLREKRSEEAARQRDSNSTSLMLVAIVSIFLIVNLPQAIFMGLLCVCETFTIKIPILEGTFPAVFLIASNMIVIATYPINFGIYCFMSSSFRQTFKLLFCPGASQLQCERRIEAASAVHSSRRRSDICSHLVNVCTNSEGFMQVSHHCLHVDYLVSDRQSTQFTTMDRSD
ncbi:Sex peptide receptor-related protein 2 [Caenorhabditis elegans]|uniref:Sex peptide receptor-related protein 2 n=1 Tax=Caenorhabditis elegans TaxID=6239 RepID=SPRR2_CAEEL|nr:Sex peptide receptor-related protein 2 [Caenorhabditis elegans]Q93704.2 RecName: Full=Sex peptide receptor-related protein 2; AltName: Full=Myoinhibitory-like protein receptor homolog [Caenorhabditis elegans]CAB03091.2 Sex peptide receptor-related protein 2 [Caenorhabditis elegans]|eukprot:NP_510455.2 Sex Peptide Receptor (Drosophila) Related [Caenorhabditis elegans]